MISSGEVVIVLAVVPVRGGLGLWVLGQALLTLLSQDICLRFRAVIVVQRVVMLPVRPTEIRR